MAEMAFSTPAEKDTSPAAVIFPTVPEPGLGMIPTHASSAQMLTPATCIHGNDCATTTSSLPRIVVPRRVTETLVSSPKGVSATTVTLGHSNAATKNSNLSLQSTSTSDTVTSESSISSLVNPVSSVVSTTTLEVSESFAPGIPIMDDTTATLTNLQTVANSSHSDSPSVCNSTTSLPDIPTIFSDFTPCTKCNSILVCSCPGPSSVGGGNNSALTTCQASCTGLFTCEGMEVDGKEDFKPFEQDVKPPMSPTPVPLNRLDQLFDGLIEYDKITKAEQPEVITTRLFPYQLQALNWMITRENNTDLAPFWNKVNKSTWFNKGTNMSTDRKPHSPKGGILADDMGLGKTLVVISLIMANHLHGKPMFSRSINKRKMSNSDQDGECKHEPKEKMPHRGSSDEDDPKDIKEEVKVISIKKRKHVTPKKKRLADSKMLKEPGFKFRQMYLSQLSSKSTKKEKDKNKVKKELPQLVSIDNDFNTDVAADLWLSTGNDSINRSDRGKENSPSEDEHSATLIVCPLSVLSNWTDQICSHVHGDVSLQVYMYYGAERLRDVNFLRQQDVVLTTYPTLTNDYSRLDSPLHKIKWLRVILDEGHTIRNPQTRLTKAMIDLVAMRRWVLTGTPIQNRLDDLWSVVKFLRLEPFDDKKWWNAALASSVRRGDELAVNRLQKLLKHISIRRLKTDQDEGRPLVKLPPRTVVIQEVELSEEERKLYDSMQKHGQLIIKKYLQNGTVLAKYAHCFAILMRLRQLCLHPKLCEEECHSLQRAQDLLQGLEDSDDDDLDMDYNNQRLIKDLLATLSSGSDEECSVCLESLVEPVITRCAHAFCQQCIMDVMTSENLAPRCPLCRAPLNVNELIKVSEKKKQKLPSAKKTSEDSDSKNKSSKLDALMGALCAIRDKDPFTKSLVVSQFTSFLDLIEEALHKEDFNFVRLDGRMMQETRARAIESFAKTCSSSPTVFLLSLTAGGVGLNLTAATRVFLMDPAWNPAIEEQCFDRSHRLGQTQEVIITKYIVMNSVEERMLTLQEGKRTLMGQAFGVQRQSQEERRRARVRDIKHLIGL
ncbi:helicase-like transcription factor [Stylophora pistillata]|uniref:Helicase-like transcription factor n=1 Tax=Stylophora pistillata TaxID=50429 RepID=A0A2B4T368_STYPI|nr:helicase-like transcription factor [Stylophora pistillata]PFX35045.1 Helicase-like transcription factor [Stylophora pistillata]